MSNRRLTKVARLRRSYRNAEARAAKANPGYARREDGGLVRAGGARNYPYGATAGSRLSITTLHRMIARETAADSVALDTLSRDELRAEAKRRGLTGYSGLKKAELIEALS